MWPMNTNLPIVLPSLDLEFEGPSQDNKGTCARLGAAIVDGAHAGIQNFVSFGLLEAYGQPMVKEYLVSQGYSESMADFLATAAATFTAGAVNSVANTALQKLEATEGLSRLDSKAHPFLLRGALRPLTAVGVGLGAAAIVGSGALAPLTIATASALGSAAYAGLLTPAIGALTGLKPVPRAIRNPDSEGAIHDFKLRTLAASTAYGMTLLAKPLGWVAQAGAGLASWYFMTQTVATAEQLIQAAPELADQDGDPQAPAAPDAATPTTPAASAPGTSANAIDHPQADAGHDDDAVIEIQMMNTPAPHEASLPAATGQQAAAQESSESESLTSPDLGMSLPSPSQVVESLSNLSSPGPTAQAAKAAAARSGVSGEAPQDSPSDVSKPVIIHVSPNRTGNS